jgi:hypothetical protein
MGNLEAVAVRPRGASAHKNAPEPKISIVEMKEVPEPSTRSRYTELFDKLYRLDGTKAARVEFGSESQANGGRASMRKQAEKVGCKFRANRGHEAGFVWYLWVERPENRGSLAAARGKPV